MRHRLPVRFWFEATTALIGVMLFVLTLITREWFEVLTGLDPDGGSGALEVAIVFTPLAMSVASGIAARRDYRRAVLSV
jgi:hypothetical protein